MRTAPRLVLRCASVAALAGVAWFMLPGWRGATAAFAALLLFTIAAAEVTARLASRRAPKPGLFDAAVTAAGMSVRRPPDLEHLERLLGWGSYSPKDFDHRVRPVLMRLIAYKLRAGYAVDLDRDRARAWKLLPPDLWWVVQGCSDRQDVVRTAHIATAIEAIENL